MGLMESLIFYLLIGAGVSAALALSEEPLPLGERAFCAATGIVFWPLYLPGLLRGPVASQGTIEAEAAPEAAPRDGLAAAIAQVEAELDTALCSLDGWAGETFVVERGRLAELRSAWRVQAARIRELDELLARPEFVAPGPAAPEEPETAPPPPSAPADRLRQAEEARRENIERLRLLRRQLHDDLVGTLAWVRELVTMIHLAKFSGAPASRAEELVAQIAAAVEGLSEVTSWQDEPLAGTTPAR